MMGVMVMSAMMMGGMVMVMGVMVMSGMVMVSW